MPKHTATAPDAQISPIRICIFDLQRWCSTINNYIFTETMSDIQNQSFLQSMNMSDESLSAPETSSQSRLVVVRAPHEPSWLTDEELLALDQAFIETMEKLLEDGINVEVLRFQGCENFPPLLLDKGFGVALCINKAKKNDYRVIPFSSVENKPFCTRLRTLATDRHSHGFRYKDLLFSFQVTNYFRLHPPSNPPKSWRPESPAGFDIFHSSKRATSYVVEEPPQSSGLQSHRPATPRQKLQLSEHQQRAQSTEPRTPRATKPKQTSDLAEAAKRSQSAVSMSPRTPEGRQQKFQPLDTKRRPPWRP